MRILTHKYPVKRNLKHQESTNATLTFNVTTMMAGKNQAALAVCAQTIVVFPAFKFDSVNAW